MAEPTAEGFKSLRDKNLKEPSGATRMKMLPGYKSLAKKTLQIATFGEGDKEIVLAGIKYLAITKLILLTVSEQKVNAYKFAENLGLTLNIETEVHEVAKPILLNTLNIFKEILRKEAGKFEEVIVNAGSGDKELGCAALTAAFINGLKAIAISQGVPVLLPIIKLSYTEMISEPKINILQALDKAGGVVKDLDQLSKLTGYGKPLLSYHINGSEDSKGLIGLGLIEISKTRRGRLQISLSPLGKMFLIGIGSE